MGQMVEVAVIDDEVMIAYDGHEIERHPLIAPGEISIKDEYYWIRSCFDAIGQDSDGPRVAHKPSPRLDELNAKVVASDELVRSLFSEPALESRPLYYPPLVSSRAAASALGAVLAGIDPAQHRRSTRRTGCLQGPGKRPWASFS